MCVDGELATIPTYGDPPTGPPPYASAELSTRESIDLGLTQHSFEKPDEEVDLGEEELGRRVDEYQVVERDWEREDELTKQLAANKQKYREIGG